MAISRDELFRKAKELRKKAKEEGSRESFSGEDYEQTVYTSVPLEGVKIFRIFGDPLAIRTKPTDPKLSFISMILADNGKKFRCIWPSKEENKNWILWKIMDTVLDGNWEKGKDGKNVKILKHLDSHPECVRRVDKNDSDNKFERGWYPSKYVNFNIIDREDPEFHAEKKQSKLLSKRASEIGDSGNFWYDPGIPEMAYNTIWDDVVEYYGRWDLYDVAMKKEQVSPWYKAFHCLEERKKLEQIDPDAMKFVVEGEMTDEEKAYQLYDLDRLYGVTSYTKIKAKLGDFIKKVDVDFKKNFTEELEAQVKKEQEEYEARRAEKEKSAPKATTVEKANPAEEETEEETEEKKEAPTVKSRVVKERKVTSAKIDWNALLDGTFNGTKYLGVSEMTDEEKSMVLSVKENGSFEYVKEFEGHTLDLMENPRSKFAAPDLFHIDPLNGDVF